jgi:hypothetical protein
VKFVIYCISLTNGKLLVKTSATEERGFVGVNLLVLEYYNRKASMIVPQEEMQS